jgi:alkylation response protein AidB-like acyl-CoA dehydrogenase
MAANIVHLVLARLPDAPKGSKGISLFVVPKFNVKADGSLGERNPIYCSGLEHKMGIHGNATGADRLDGAIGTLVGKPHKGLAAMFVMMNAARLGVGNQSLGLTEVAYQNALAYAKDRIQMRSLSGPKAKDKDADPIIVHPDVRKMLLTAKAYAEGARACCRSTARCCWTRCTATPTKRCAPNPRRTRGAAHAHRQGLHHRQRAGRHQRTACRSTAATASSRNGAWSSTCATTAST